MRLLLAEDESRLAAALRRGLLHEGFEVDIAPDGQAALDLAAQHRYAVVLLDIMLPKVSGYEVTRRLRERGDWTPILVLSAKDGEHDQADGLDLGADDYLVKPFSFVVLMARLRALLRRGRVPRPAVLRRGELNLDPAAHTVTLRGEPVSLTSRELRLLEYLLRRGDAVVTKAELLTEVWHAEPDADPNVVEVYIGYLRRKLGAGVVETVRGAGYRLQPP